MMDSDERIQYTNGRIVKAIGHKIHLIKKSRYESATTSSKDPLFRILLP